MTALIRVFTVVGISVISVRLFTNKAPTYRVGEARTPALSQKGAVLPELFGLVGSRLGASLDVGAHTVWPTD